MAVSTPTSLGTNQNAGGSLTIVLTTTGAVPVDGKIVVVVGWFINAGQTFSGMSGGGLTWRTDLNTPGTRCGIAICSADAPAGLASSTALTATFSASTGDRFISGSYVTGAETGDFDYGLVSQTETTNAWSSTVVETATGDIRIGGSRVDEVSGSPTNTPGSTEVVEQTTADGESMVTVYDLSGGSVALTGSWSGTVVQARSAAVAYAADRVLSRYSTEVLADSPRAYWRLGAAPTLDYSGNGFALSLFGSVPAIAGIVPSEAADGARDFDGAAGNYYEVAAASIPDSLDYPGTAPFTLECWAKCDFSDTDFVRLLSHESGTDGWMLYSQVNDGYGMGRNCSGAFDTTHTKPTDFIGGLYHIVGTYDGTQQILYLNGVPGTPNADTASIVNFSATLRIGRSSPGGDSFDGVIDEVAVYDGALSQARILAHYNAGLAAQAGMTRWMSAVGW